MSYVICKKYIACYGTDEKPEAKNVDAIRQRLMM